MAATKGYGANVHYGAGTTTASPGSYTVLAAEITDITPPVAEAADIDTSHFASTSQHKEFIPGWIDAGELEITAHYTDTEYDAINTIFIARTVKPWKVTINDDAAAADSGLVFLGYVKSLGPTIDIDGLNAMTIKVKATGVILFDTDLST